MSSTASQQPGKIHDVATYHEFADDLLILDSSSFENTLCESTIDDTETFTEHSEIQVSILSEDQVSFRTADEVSISSDKVSEEKNEILANKVSIISGKEAVVRSSDDISVSSAEEALSGLVIC